MSKTFYSQLIHLIKQIQELKKNPNRLFYMKIIQMTECLKKPHQNLRRSWINEKKPSIGFPRCNGKHWRGFQKCLHLIDQTLLTMCWTILTNGYNMQLQERQKMQICQGLILTTTLLKKKKG